MLRPRLIPCLLVKDNGLVKSTQFKKYKYVGDPINSVKIFNEKEVDEIMIIDIDATVYNRPPNYRLIESIAAECRMPFCYGGGIKTIEQAQRIFSLGVEKIAISHQAIVNPNIISQLSVRVGSQSVVIILDVKQHRNGNYEIWTHNGTKNTGIDPVQFSIEAEKNGAGEIVINSIDNDGLMKGYDLNIIDQVRSVTNLPMTVLGGAGSLKDIAMLVEKYSIMGIAAGSLFVFKGIFKAVLINYPSRIDKEALINIQIT